ILLQLQSQRSEVTDFNNSGPSNLMLDRGRHLNCVAGALIKIQRVQVYADGWSDDDARWEDAGSVALIAGRKRRIGQRLSDVGRQRIGQARNRAEVCKAIVDARAHAENGLRRCLPREPKSGRPVVLVGIRASLGPAVLAANEERGLEDPCLAAREDSVWSRN